MHCSKWPSSLLCLLILASGLQRLAQASPGQTRLNQEQFDSNLVKEIGISENMLRYSPALLQLLNQTHNNIHFYSKEHFFKVLDDNWDKENFLANTLSPSQRLSMSKALDKLPLTRSYSKYRARVKPNDSMYTQLVFEGSHPASMNRHLSELKQKINGGWGEHPGILLVLFWLPAMSILSVSCQAKSHCLNRYNRNCRIS